MEQNKKKTSIGRAFVIAAVVFFGFATCVYLTPKGDTEKPEPPQKPLQATEKITAEVSQLNRKASGGELLWDVSLKNTSKTNQTFYLIAHARNDFVSPPHRAAWPLGGLLFRLARTKRGALTIGSVKSFWGKECELTPKCTEQSKGHMVKIKAGKSKRIKGAFPNKPFAEYKFWVFDNKGELVLNKEFK